MEPGWEVGEPRVFFLVILFGIEILICIARGKGREGSILQNDEIVKFVMIG